eukprot:5128935-Heterocapsa_arctica.AAC.1
MENIKIQVYSHGMPCYIYEFDGEDEQHKSTISVLWCNINRWGAQENHYDLLIPIKYDTSIKNTFEETFYDKVEEDTNNKYWKDNYNSNYIGRRCKNEVER